MRAIAACAMLALACGCNQRDDAAWSRLKPGDEVIAWDGEGGLRSISIKRLDSDTQERFLSLPVGTLCRVVGDDNRIEDADGDTSTTREVLVLILEGDLANHNTEIPRMFLRRKPDR